MLPVLVGARLLSGRCHSLRLPNWHVLKLTYLCTQQACLTLHVSLVTGYKLYMGPLDD